MTPAGNTNPYYAIYGIAPASIGSGTNVNITLGNNNANCYAGYFVGDVFCSNTYYYSDPKLKENIAEYKGALDKLNQLPVKSYTFRQNEFPTMNFPQGEQIGMLSTDIKQVFPNLVKQTTQPAIKGKGGDVAFEAVNYNSLIPVLVQAVKELDLKTQSHAPTDDLLHTISAQQAQLTRQAQQIADQDRKTDNLHAMLEDLHRSENKEAENQKDHDAVLYPAVFDSVTHSVSIDYRVDRMHTESSIRVETKEGTLISQQDISRHNIGTLLFPLSMLANVGCKYSLVIDGKIVDTRSMMIPSK